MLKFHLLNTPKKAGRKGNSCGGHLEYMTCERCKTKVLKGSEQKKNTCRYALGCTAAKGAKQKGKICRHALGCAPVKDVKGSEQKGTAVGVLLDVHLSRMSKVQNKRVQL